MMVENYISFGELGNWDGNITGGGLIFSLSLDMANAAKLEVMKDMIATSQVRYKHKLKRYS